jgi:hypothetical protein
VTGWPGREMVGRPPAQPPALFQYETRGQSIGRCHESDLVTRRGGPPYVWVLRTFGQSHLSRCLRLAQRTIVTTLTNGISREQCWAFREMLCVSSLHFKGRIQCVWAGGNSVGATVVEGGGQLTLDEYQNNVNLLAAEVRRQI